MAEVEYVTKSEFARRLNLHNTEVGRLVRKGTIIVKNINGKIRIPYRQERRKLLKEPNYKKRADALNDPEEASKVIRGTTKSVKATKSKSDGKITDISDARFMLEKFKAKKAKEEYLLLAGTTVKVSEVANTWALIASNLKKTVLGVPPRIKAILAANTSPHECGQILKKELIKCLQDSVDTYRPQDDVKVKPKKKINKKIKKS